MEKISIEPDCIFSPQPMYIIGTKNEDGSANFFKSMKDAIKKDK